MNSSIVTGMVSIFLAFIVYTLALMTGGRWARERGLRSVQLGMSLLWWIGIDALMGVASYFLAASTYRMWVPSDGTLDEVSPMLEQAFRGSGLEIADILAMFLTLLAMGLAHALAYSGILVRQTLTMAVAERPSTILIATYVIGFVTLLTATAYVLKNWEAPVIAVRIAQMLGSPTLDDRIEDILSISNIWSLIGRSWLLTSICWVWCIGIVFTSWGTVKSHIAFDNAMTDGVLTPASITAAAAVPSPLIDEVEATQQNVAIPIPTRAETAASTEENVTAAAEARAEQARQRAREARQTEVDAVTAAIPPPRNTADVQPTETERALVTQTEELLDENEELRRERDLLRARQARSPLDLPNNRSTTVPSPDLAFARSAGTRSVVNLDDIGDAVPIVSSTTLPTGSVV